MCVGDGVSGGGDSEHHDGQRTEEMIRDQSAQSMAIGWEGKRTRLMCLLHWSVKVRESIL